MHGDKDNGLEPDHSGRPDSDWQAALKRAKAEAESELRKIHAEAADRARQLLGDE